MAKRAPPADREVNPRQSVCPYCGVGCSLAYEGEGSTTGREGPINEAGQLCPKGAAAGEMVTDGDRLIRPLVRESGYLVTASWSEAFDRIEQAIGDIVEADGPDAMAWLASASGTNEENYLLQKLARATGTNNVDNCARLCHASTVTALEERFGTGAMTNTLDDLEAAETLLIVGANPADQHPVAFRHYVQPALREGATLVHIDPRANATTEAADHHLPVRPGQDIPLLNAMAAVIDRAGQADERFMAERTTDLARYRAQLGAIDVEASADRAGVEPAALRAAAMAYGGADRAAALTGMGLSQHHHGTDNVRALVNLALLTGNVGRPGTGINPLRGQNNVQGAGDVGALPATLPGGQPVTDAAAREAVGSVWGFAPPATPGRTQLELTARFGDEVRGAYVFGENPLVTEPDSQTVREAFDSLELLVVQDLFLTETAEHADVVLPGSAWAEKAGTVTNTDRRVMRMRASTTPPRGARRDFTILTELARRLVGKSCMFETPRDAFEELTAVSPRYRHMSYDEIGTGYQRWPAPSDGETDTQVLHAHRYAGGDRQAPFVPVERQPEMATLDPEELVLTTGRTLEQFNSGTLTRRSALLTQLGSDQHLQIHPTDAEARDIADGQSVTVSSDQGSIRLRAERTRAIREGAVFCTFHRAETVVNRLIDGRLDPDAQIPAYKHTPVTVSPGE